MQNLEILRKKLKKFDKLVGKEVLDFIYDVYDSETSAFYYTKSGSLDKNLLPDIEATYFSLLVLEAGGIFKDSYPDFFKEKLSAWVKSKQCESDGYFYLPQWGKTSGSRRDRDLNFALEIRQKVCYTVVYNEKEHRRATYAYHDYRPAGQWKVYRLPDPARHLRL